MEEAIAKINAAIEREAIISRKTLLIQVRHGLQRLYFYDSGSFIRRFEELIEKEHEIVDFISGAFSKQNRYENPMKRYAEALQPINATSVGCFSYRISTNLQLVDATCWDGESCDSGPMGIDGYCLFGFALERIYKIEILRKEWVGNVFGDNVSLILLGEKPISEIQEQYATMRHLLLGEKTKHKLHDILTEFEEHPVIVFMQGIYNLLGCTVEVKTMSHCFEIISSAYARYGSLLKLRSEEERDITLRDLYAGQEAMLASLETIEKQMKK